MCGKDEPEKAYEAWIDDGAGLAYAGDPDVKNAFQEGFVCGHSWGRIDARHGSMTLEEISKINRARAARWHSGGEEWSASDWSNALSGETGELFEAIIDALALGAVVGRLANSVKKVRRHETHVDQISGGQGSYNTPPLDLLEQRVKSEVADVFLYLDLLAAHFNLNLEDCIFPKFNAVSEAQGFPERLGDA